MFFEVISDIDAIETIASGTSIRDLRRLRKAHGGTRWRKKKGLAMIRLHDGTIFNAELHWYEAHGIGKREFKVKRLFHE